MSYGCHSHYFAGTTTLNHEHTHEYSGITSCVPDTPGHVHYMYGETTLDNGHIHYYNIVTSPAIEANGGHIHYYESATSLNNGHIHYMYGYTGTAA